ncbi:hypothetical protein GC167_01635 [bacterium]|nr:hypothetical protein [bacterium]
MTPAPSPRALLVGGLGGSGTRVFSELLEAMGLMAPALVNRSLDDLIVSTMLSDSTMRTGADPQKMTHFLTEFKTYRSGQSTEGQIDRWLLALQRTRHPILPQKRSELLARFEQWSTAPGIRFFKEPNLHLFFPELLRADAELKALYVVRDGRYMAHSNNRNQLERWGDFFGLSNRLAPDEAQFRLWAASGLRVQALWRKFGAYRIRIVRLEDLLMNPSATAESLLEWLDTGLRLPEPWVFQPASVESRSIQHPGKPEWEEALQTLGYF